MISAEVLRDNLSCVRERMGKALAESGRGAESVRLIAVSKFHPAEAIAAAALLGQKDFGENYAQEALAKQDLLAERSECHDITWHFIGHIQTRKAALLGGRFALIHTVDSLKLGEALEKRAVALDVCQPVLIQVNIGAEPQKSGVMPEELLRLAEQLCVLPHLSLQGLMCLPPVFDAGEAARPYFARLRRLCEDLRVALGLPLPELSMGMSGDFMQAIAEGATFVRIGTDIFGMRQTS